MSHDLFELGGLKLKSRLFTGTGKYPSDALIPDILKKSGAEVITVALRRVDFNSVTDNVMKHIPSHIKLLPNTSGARDAEEAVRIARLARASGCGNWIKLEIITDNHYLLPDGNETVRATEILVKENFVVLPYINPDLYISRNLRECGASAIMPLGSPIGTNRGLKTEEMIRIIIEEIDLPVIVDAGIGRPSQAAHAMEMGAAACLVNTAIAGSDNPVLMAEAFGFAVKSGRKAFLAGLGTMSTKASASSPLTHFLE